MIFLNLLLNTSGLLYVYLFIYYYYFSVLCDAHLSLLVHTHDWHSLRFIIASYQFESNVTQKEKPAFEMDGTASDNGQELFCCLQAHSLDTHM